MKFDEKKFDKAYEAIKTMNLDELELIRKFVYDFIKLRVKLKN